VPGFPYWLKLLYAATRAVLEVSGTSAGYLLYPLVPYGQSLNGSGASWKLMRRDAKPQRKDDLNNEVGESLGDTPTIDNLPSF
jgi:hypothetical protein